MPGEYPGVIVGSSPRGRGKLLSQMDWQIIQRLIPAWAGKTRDEGAATASPRAHPRVGGENIVCVTWSRCPKGSSPRGRGKQSARSIE